MSDAGFRSAFELLVSTTDEYSYILPLFENSILPRLSKTETLLDVGSGPGLITVPLSSHFDEVAIVEPDPDYCLEAVKKILEQGKVVTAFNGTWDAARLEGHQYDLIVCAHVLYFVPYQDWETFIEKMVPHVAPGGRMAIILVAKGDQASEQICRSLGIRELGLHPFSAAVIDIVKSKNLPFEVLSIEASITVHTAMELESMLPLFPIMKCDPGSTQEQRLAMVEEQFKVGDRYRLPYTVDVVLVEAPG